jgi:ubiquitin C-terminal hydrolase
MSNKNEVNTSEYYLDNNKSSYLGNDSRERVSKKKELKMPPLIMKPTKKNTTKKEYIEKKKDEIDKEKKIQMSQTMIYDKKKIRNINDIEKMNEEKEKEKKDCNGKDNNNDFDKDSYSSETLAKSKNVLNSSQISEKEKEKEKKSKIPKKKRRKRTDMEMNSHKKISNDDNIINKICTSTIGLENLGNTCFMNTCLQNLIHSEYFIKSLIYKKELVSKRNTPVTYYFIKLLELIISSNNQDFDFVSPKDFKEIISTKHHRFRGYSQQDCQEFCRIILEDMNQELNEIEKPEPYKELSTLNKSKMECDKEFDETFKKRENSLIMDSFYSQIINIFKCECGFETYSFQKVLDFPLLLPKKSDSKVTIKELLDEFFETEEIKFETKCEKCHKKKNHEKKIKFSQPPNILILSLQRIDERKKKKNKCLVEFPEKLCIIDYIDDDCGHKNENKYELYGMCKHIGDMEFGHYFAYIKINGKQWYEFNDSKVKSFPEESYSSFESSSAYILFYQKL